MATKSQLESFDIDAIEHVGMALIDNGFAHFLVKSKLVPRLSLFDKITYWIETVLPLETRLKRAFESAGGTYSLFGKWLGERQDLFAPPISQALRKINVTALPEFSQPVLQKLVKKEFPKKRIKITNIQSETLCISFLATIGKTKYHGRLLPPYYYKKIQQELVVIRDFAELYDEHHPNTLTVPLKMIAQEFMETILHALTPKDHIKLYKFNKSKTMHSKYALLHDSDIHIPLLDSFKKGFVLDEYYSALQLNEHNKNTAKELLLATKNEDVQRATQAFLNATQFRHVSSITFKNVFDSIHLTRDLSWVFTTAQRLGVPLAPWARSFCATVTNVKLTIHQLGLDTKTQFTQTPLVKQQKPVDSNQILVAEFERIASKILYGIFIATFTIIASLFVLFGTEDTIIVSSIIFVIGLFLAVLVIKHNLERK